MKKLVLAFYILGMSVQFYSAQAQDIHYSQHIYNPLYYNPAFTGFIQSKARITASYADRYRQAYGKNGMRTSFASGDINIPISSEYSKGGNLGVGAYFYNHMAGENSIMDNVGAVSVAYRLALDKDKKHTLSAGFNVSFMNRRYDYSYLQFGNQFDGAFYDPLMNSGEQNAFPSVNKIDAGLGLLYAFVGTDHLRGYVGASAFHLVPDKNNVINFGQALRYNVHAGLEADIKDITLEPSFMLDRQDKAMELYTGVLFKYKVLDSKDQKLAVFIGPYLRMYSSPVGGFSLYTVNAFGGVRFNEFQLFVAADNTINTSKNTFSGFNGFEVGFNYAFGDLGANGKRLYCPTFR